MQKFVENGTLRRLVVTAVAMGAVVLNKKVGLELDTGTQDLLVYLAMTYITGSNAKEAMVARAKAAGDAAAAAVTDPEAVLKAAAKKEEEAPK
jgi:hypothetical protein